MNYVPAYVYVGKNQYMQLKKESKARFISVDMIKNGKLPPIHGAEIIQVDRDDHLEYSHGRPD